ncbi:hypothetical protein GCM10028794_02250 [Silanimonas algicola]
MAIRHRDDPLFPPHGRIEVHPHGRVVYFEANGPLNAEAVAAMRSAYTPVMAAMAADGPFGHISTFHGSMLATPEALQAFTRLLDEWRASGLIPTVNAYVVAADVEGRNLLLPRYAAAFGREARFRAFEDLESAEAWVVAQLAEHG